MFNTVLLAPVPGGPLSSAIPASQESTGLSGADSNSFAASLSFPNDAAKPSFGGYVRKW